MGRSCLNLVSPAHFYCHILGCKKLIVLGYSSKLSLVVRHWEDHAVAENDEGPGSDMCPRYRYIEKFKDGKNWLLGGDVATRLQESENLTAENGKQLNISSEGIVLINT